MDQLNLLRGWFTFHSWGLAELAIVAVCLYGIYEKLQTSDKASARAVVRSVRNLSPAFIVSTFVLSWLFLGILIAIYLFLGLVVIKLNLRPKR